MWSHLERGSSPVDWCESNYSISPLIAEFVNTFSNVLFLLFPPLLIHLFQQYAEFVNPSINLLWVLLMVVGISSAYFHATLSLLGQLLDELAILWVCMTAFAMFFPKRRFPHFLKGSRRALSYMTGVLAALLTGLLALRPAANAFLLMTMVLPALAHLLDQIRGHSEPRVHWLGLRCVAGCTLGVGTWVTDRLFCATWLSLNFPYLHGVWHVLSCIFGYTSLVLFAYLNACDETPEKSPQLRYWPRDHFELGVPYVAFGQPTKKPHHLEL